LKIAHAAVGEERLYFLLFDGPNTSLAATFSDLLEA
jgi:hypothetical protein